MINRHFFSKVFICIFILFSISGCSSEIKEFYIRDSVKLGSFSYKINSINWKNDLSGLIFDSNARGKYFVIGLTVKNIGKKPSSIPNNFMLIDNENREFAIKSNPLTYPGFSFSELNPGLSTKGYVIFDVPEDNEFLYTLKIIDGNKKVLINTHP